MKRVCMHEHTTHAHTHHMHARARMARARYMLHARMNSCEKKRANKAHVKLAQSVFTKKLRVRKLTKKGKSAKTASENKSMKQLA